MQEQRSWTPSQIQYLRDNWGTLTYKQLAQNLQRTVGAVKAKAYKMGLRFYNKPFDGGIHYTKALPVEHWTKAKLFLQLVAAAKKKVQETGDTPKINFVKLKDVFNSTYV